MRYMYVFLYCYKELSENTHIIYGRFFYTNQYQIIFLK